MLDIPHQNPLKYGFSGIEIPLIYIKPTTMSHKNTGKQLGKHIQQTYKQDLVTMCYFTTRVLKNQIKFDKNKTVGRI